MQPGKAKVGSQGVEIKLRGHHLFCTMVSDAEADDIYNPRFGENMRTYQRRMKADPEQVIKIVATVCDTCAFCPSLNVRDNKCLLYDYRPGANQIDLDILRPLGLEIGMELTVSELRKRIISTFTSLPSMCYVDCPFREILHCHEGLEQLRSEE